MDTRSNHYKICVIIPVHRPLISPDEITSLLQCKKVLSSYAVYLLHPAGMNIEHYTDVYPELLSRPVSTAWLSSIAAYNKMKRSLAFYNLFEDYDFMLTYELDSYIFSDNWYEANCFLYDYIGAPWFEGYLTSVDSDIIGVGNSGFSMRNIKKCILVLKKLEKVKRTFFLFQKTGINKFIRFTLLLRLSSNIWNVNANNYYFIPLSSDNHINEDTYWSTLVPKVFNFKIASIQDSIKFSFEAQPAKLFQKNNYRLPLGCHAWTKCEPQFWSSYIEKKNSDQRIIM